LENFSQAYKHRLGNIAEAFLGTNTNKRRRQGGTVIKKKKEKENRKEEG
jgi:hypothetical protein